MKQFLHYAFILNTVFLGLLFFTAGMGKLFFEHQFVGLMGPVWLEERLAEFNLGLFARFIAYSQVIIGFTLFTFRFNSLGSVMLLPMLANILVITISQNWVGTPYVVSVFILQNLYLLWFDRNQFLHLVSNSSVKEIKLRNRTWIGNLCWIFALGCILGSISLSYHHLKTAWFLAFTGVALGILSNKIDSKFEAKNTI